MASSLMMELSSLPSAYLPAPYSSWAWLALLLASMATLLPRYGSFLSMALEKQALISRAVLRRSQSSVVVAARNPLQRLNLVRSRSVDSALNLQEGVIRDSALNNLLQGSISSCQQHLPVDGMVRPINVGGDGGLLEEKAPIIGNQQDSMAIVPREQASMSSIHGSSHMFKIEHGCEKQRHKALQSSSSSSPPCPAVAPVVHHVAVAPKLKEPFRWDFCLSARLEGLTQYSITPHCHQSKTKGIAIPDGNNFHSHFASVAVKLWCPHQDQSLHGLHLPSITHKVSSLYVERWDDHGLLCVGHRKGEISLWDIETEAWLGVSSSSKYCDLSVSAFSLNDGLGFITGVAEHAHSTYRNSVILVDHRSDTWIVSKHSILLGFPSFAVADVEAKAYEVHVIGADTMLTHYDLRAMRRVPIGGVY